MVVGEKMQPDVTDTKFAGLPVALQLFSCLRLIHATFT